MQKGNEMTEAKTAETGQTGPVVVTNSVPADMANRTFGERYGVDWVYAEVAADGGERPVPGLGTMTFEDETHELRLGFRSDDEMRAFAATLGLTVDIRDMPVDEPAALEAARDAVPDYTDSTPRLHVGDSAFEGWYQGYCMKTPANPKQAARDAYAAGMGDPLVVARDAGLSLTGEQIDAIHHAVMAGDPRERHTRTFARAILAAAQEQRK